MPMTGGIPVEQRIDAIDVFARNIYLRVKQEPSLAEVADAVRQLHTGLRHLRVEAADPDSLLSDPSSVYASQVSPLVEDCSRTLRLLEHALNDEGRGLGSVKAQLKGRKATIDSFLDAVQLQNPRSRPGKSVVDTAQPGLDGIKDKVDQIAEKIFQRKNSGFGDGDDNLWEEFQSELEKQGFDPAILRQHKDVLRAYIRSIQTLSHNNGSPPTLQRLLKYEEKTCQVPSDEKEAVPRSPVDDPKYIIHPEDDGPKAKEPPPPLPPKIPIAQDLRQPVAELPSSPNAIARTFPSDNMTLISTKELLAMDSLDSDMAQLQIHKHHHHHHRQHSRNTMGHSPSDGRHGRDSYRGSSSRLNLPDQQDSSVFYGSSPLVAPPRGYHSLGSSPSNPGMTHHFRLAPDRYGRQIPPDAEWTKINRDLVSPQVLEKARVRYEARPKYVAILGHLTKEQIADFVRQTTDARRARDIRQTQRADSRSSRDDDDDESDDSDKFSDSDTTDIDDDKTSEKGTKSYPFIVSPPDKTSPSSTVPPKSILKKNHVHFADHGDSDSRTSHSLRDDRSSRSDDYHHHRRRRDSDNYGSRDYHRESSDRSSHHSSKRHSPPDDRDRYDRSRHYNDDHDSHYSNSSRYREQGRRPQRDSDSQKSKKKALGGTLGAVGIGGAAISLLSVLAEAAI
ncbi:unnamed protein product [Clonostachys byssicola]|uniref:DUF8035 domain-containing protein n=1 Tax=Clonostachys byssicola TaxID=160290 RepID=A0A9N9UYM9_9HYPO|nr:unnamed protein product [Clonostachys byssicola]